MREIKYRAFDKASGIMFGIDGFDKKYVWGYKAGVKIKVKRNEVILMQYTGLQDKNGKEIREGDIFHLGDKNIKYQVVWNDTGLQGKQIRSSSYTDLQYWGNCIEVIGNIYENPELTKE
ncbi:YopX family protein [Anaerosacchariphilus polymeriproducens]|uniref:YopX protein domain-containing protein n=1 Tax=Anaerosacchariphilus polymeriproducens TaxID=1812858 RepID=A0A371ATG5_9FIRM|nr:YopX family protein [Anaerosacchariphilus polymeriproducens]RDU22875.1 hypothetical protein DWV06_12445 [Anaerosacchariphilus polymeriproducens]